MKLNSENGITRKTKQNGCIVGLFIIFTLMLLAAVPPVVADCPMNLLSANDVVWHAPSADSRGSMPLGNGDLGLNVWVTTNGDLLFYVSKSDAWSDNVYRNKGLLKLGRVRVKLSPPLPVGQNFSQALKLADGAVEIHAGAADSPVTLRVWVDANRPLVHVETEAPQPDTVSVAFETLRPSPDKDIHADTILTNATNRVIWYYRNENQHVPELTGLTFGAAISGDDLVSTDPTDLRSTKPARRHVITLCALTAQTPSGQAWLHQLNTLASRTEAVPPAAAWREHGNWWRDFWNRSWIFVSGDADARRVTEGYVLQRFVTACAGRGAYPIKFNGSILNVDYQSQESVHGVATNIWMSADERSWGGQYWFQNTRAIYWPLLESGDFDELRPLFQMFRAMLPGNEQEVRDFYHHDGAYFAETKPFYGGINQLKPEAPGKYTDFYYTPILELSAMMLDYFAYTGNTNFVRETLLPIADAGVTFFDQHWPHENGRLLLDPDNAIEMYWKAKNPAPDIAGLHWVLRGLLALPKDLTTMDQRARWQRFLKELPDLPTGETNGVKVLLPAEVYGRAHNAENPELYSIYPFRIFGLHQPDLDLAKATFAARRCKNMGCWNQDGVQAALLGETDVARKNVIFNLTRKSPQMRFTAFWAKGHDYVPDEDNGGNGMNILQLMLMQSDGRKIYLLPAWPKNWNANFKLHAPLNTTVEGKVSNGKVECLNVTPASRRSDVTISEASD